MFKKYVVEANGKNLSLDDMINKFLFYQRNTPRSNDARTPSQLIFSFKPKILLDLLKYENKNLNDKDIVITERQPANSNGKKKKRDMVNVNIPKFAIGNKNIL